MFVIDRILLSPVTGFFWLMKELHNAVEAEREGEKDRLTSQLRTLYMQLETGRITESEFDEAEAKILDRLDELDAMGEQDAYEEDDEDEEAYVAGERELSKREVADSPDTTDTREDNLDTEGKQP